MTNHNPYSAPYRVALDLMIKETSWEQEQGPLGEYKTLYRIFTIPEHWTDEDLQVLMHEVWPGERCQHSYDCCANWYPSLGQFTRLRRSRILVEQSWTLNI